MNDLNQELRVDNLSSPQDVPVATTISTNAGMYRSMSKYRKGLIVVSAYLTDTKTAIGQLTCASDANGTGKANVTGKTVTLTGTVGKLDVVGAIEFDASNLDLEWR